MYGVTIMRTVSEMLMRCCLLAVLEAVLPERGAISRDNFLLLDEEHSSRNQLVNTVVFLCWCYFIICRIAVPLTLLCLPGRCLLEMFGVLPCVAVTFLSFNVSRATLKGHGGTNTAFISEPVFAFGAQLIFAYVYIVGRTQLLSPKYGVQSVYKQLAPYWMTGVYVVFVMMPSFCLASSSTREMEKLTYLLVICAAVDLMLALIEWTQDAVIVLVEHVKFVMDNPALSSESNALRRSSILLCYWLTKMFLETSLVFIREHEDSKHRIYRNFALITDTCPKVKYSEIMTNVNCTDQADYSMFHHVWNTASTILEQRAYSVIPAICMGVLLDRVSQHAVRILIAAVGETVNDTINDTEAVGFLCGCVFFILQLTETDSSLPLLLLLLHITSVMTVIMTYLHKLLHPLLMKISASKAHWTKHARILGMYFFMVVICFYFIWYLPEFGYWSYSMTALSCAALMSNFITSLLTYALFMADSCCDRFCDKLDDYSSYLITVDRSMTYISGIAALGVSEYFLYGCDRWVSKVMLRFLAIVILYKYLVEGTREGWKAFSDRRKAVQEMKVLSDATRSELAEYNDLCAICIRSMNTAKLTRCRHMFHESCLRRWLYHQEYCPICKETIFNLIDKSAEREADRQGRERRDFFLVLFLLLCVRICLS